MHAGILVWGDRAEARKMRHSFNLVELNSRVSRLAKSAVDATFNTRSNPALPAARPLRTRVAGRGWNPDQGGQQQGSQLGRIIWFHGFAVSDPFARVAPDVVPPDTGDVLAAIVRAFPAAPPASAST